MNEELRERLVYSVSTQEEMKRLEAAMGVFFGSLGVLSTGRIRIRSGIDNWVNISPEVQTGRIDEVIGVDAGTAHVKLHKTTPKYAIIEIGKYGYHIHFRSSDSEA